MYEQLQQLDHIRLNFGNNGSLVLNIVLAFIMFGVALGIKPIQFKTAFMHPKAVITGMISQMILLPASTFLFVSLFHSYLTLTVALGAILVAACPGGNISNFISSLSRGNVELSVSLTAISTITAIIVTPLNFPFWGNLYAETSDLVRPLTIPLGEVFKTLVLILGIPLVLGVFTSMKFPEFAKKISKPIQRISILIFSIMVVVAFAANSEYFVKYIRYIFIIVLLQNTLAFLVGYVAATTARLNDRDRRTVTIETGIQNSGMALMLIFNPAIFPPDMAVGGMAFVAAWWGVWHIIAGLSLAAFWNGKRFREYNSLKLRRRR